MNSHLATTTLPVEAAYIEAPTIPAPVVGSAAVPTSIPTSPRVQTSAATHAVVAVVGLGYVGLPTAIAMRNAGCRIIGIDTSARRLEAIQAGEAELLESEREDLEGHLAGDGFALTDRAEALDAADLVLICVPTPTDENHLPALEILEGACAAVVAHARPGQTFVLTSTTYVGSHARAARGAAGRARADGRRGRVRRVRPRAHRPGCRRSRAAADPAGDRRRDARPASGARPSCCNTPASTCTASPRRRRPRW